MRFAWTIVLALSVAACRGDGREGLAATAPGGASDAAAAEPGVAPAGAPEPVVRMRQALAAAGFPVARIERLAGHTAPLSCREEWRYRFYFSEREFLNVNRFPDEAATQACLGEYRSEMAKGGQAALDRLMPLVETDGPYLFQFSPTMVDPRRRDEILAAAKQAGGDPVR
jgi:hypothetical protein